MNQETETLLPEPERTPAAYRRDLHRARLVVGQLRDEALASGEPWTGASNTPVPPVYTTAHPGEYQDGPP